ncbi:MAG TPA: hypothetical protein VHF50_02330 [Solirubrobacterales bacterium]|nr:hypothetical protein [Solirubrobacterales bacterium]
MGEPGADIELFLLLLEHLAVTALPASLAVFAAARRGLRDVPLLLCLALAASGMSAMLAFWAFWADPLLGQAVAFLLVLGSVYGIVLCRPDRLDGELLRRLAVPAALWGLGAAFVVFLGFLHGGSDEPLALAALRFSHQLPADNQIPHYFADWYFEHGHDPVPPPFADWLSSDRPPLQVGYALAQRPFGWDETGLHYQVLGVVTQQLWIVGMWALLLAARLRPLARGLAIVAAAVSDVAIVHGFFVWPKLLAAAFVLAALAMVLSGGWGRLRGDPRAAALFAALCALAMLAHGASAFALILLLGFAALRGVPSRRWLGVAALVAIAFLGPWTVYQRFVDPPGDRLLKWQLGGSLAIDDRGALEAIVDGYEAAGLDGTLANKWGNATKIVGQRETEFAVEGAVDFAREGDWDLVVAALRFPRFVSLLPMLALLLAGPVAMAVARARGARAGPEWSFALRSLGFCLALAATWALLMFGEPDSSTLLHVGSLVLPLLAICACVAGAYSVSPRLACVLVALHAVLVLALFVPAIAPPPETSYSALAAVLAAASLAGFVLVALRPALR